MLSFRRVAEADIPAVADLARRIWRGYYPGIISPAQIEYMLERMYSMDQIRDELSSGTIYEIAESDGEPVGYLSLTPHAATSSAKLNKLYLLPELHGRGLGGLMLDRVRQLAASVHARRLRLQVNKNNARAIRAYERAGFHQAGTVCDDIGGGFVMDDLVMEREV
jgi:RimJ/RimL family protein N-acetyltransferase